MSWYNYQTGQYEEGPDPSQQPAPDDILAEAKASQEYLRKRDPNATVTPTYNPSTGKWVTDASFDDRLMVPKALRNMTRTWLAGIQTFKDDPRKSGKRIVDPNQVGYDPDYGYYMHQDNWYQKKHWQDRVAKWMPTAIMTLGTMGMGPAVGGLAKAGFGAGLGALRGLSEGQSPWNVAKNAAINAGLGYAGGELSKFINTGLGTQGWGGISPGGIAKQLATQAVKGLVYPGRSSSFSPSASAGNTKLTYPRGR
jgi:hypothetical protein